MKTKSLQTETGWILRGRHQHQCRLLRPQSPGRLPQIVSRTFVMGGRRFVFWTLLLEGPRLEGSFLVRAQIELPQVVFLDSTVPLASAGLNSALRENVFLYGRQALVKFYQWHHDAVLCPGPLQGRNTSSLETDS